MFSIKFFTLFLPIIVACNCANLEEKKDEKPTIYLCCLPEQYMTDENKCNNTESRNTTLSYPPIYLNNQSKNTTSILDYFLIHSYNVYNDSDAKKTNINLFNPNKEKNINISLYENGTIFINEKFIDKKQYCFARSVDGNETKWNIIYRITEKSKTKEVPFFLNPFLLAVLLLSGILTCSYFLRPVFHNIHQKMFTIFFGCLFVGFVAKGIYAFTLWTLFGLLTYFSFMASYCWFSVMTLDIWWILDDFEDDYAIIMERGKKKFKFYSILVWICSLVFTLICLISDLIPIDDYYPKPNFGNENFWLTNGGAIYFYIPISFPIIAGVCSLIVSVIKIYKMSKYNFYFVKELGKRYHEENKNWFKFYSILFILIIANLFIEILTLFLFRTPE